MHYPAILLSCLLLISACVPQQGVKSAAKAINPNPVKSGQSVVNLETAIRSAAPDAEIRRLIESGADLNAANAEGVTPFMALVAIRSPELVQLALQQGADVSQSVDYQGESLDALAFAQRLHGLTANAKAELKPGQFTLSGPSQKMQQPLDRTTAAQLVQKLTLVRVRQFEQKAQAEDSSLQNLQQDYRKWSRTTKAEIARLSQPIATIAEPTLPPVESFKKSPFESLALFQQRMDRAKQQREAQTKALLKHYRQRVEGRNRKVEQNSTALQRLQLEIARRNRDYPQQLEAYADNLHAKVQAQQQHFIGEAMAAVYGVPTLQAIESDGQPKYDAERGLMFASLAFSGLQGQQEIVLPVPAGEQAEQFYQQLQAGQLRPKAQFTFATPRSSEVTLSGVDVEHARHHYLARLDSKDSFIAQAPVEVVLQSKEQTPALDQQRQQAVVFDQQALDHLALQNPNIKDVQFEAFLLKEQKAFNDDIPQLLKRSAAVPIDKSKWLFVIGIGQYDQTDDILYARRSAELFSQVAARRLGIDASRMTVLLDREASSGRIQDELRLMLSKVRKGDQLYFYYSGHGLPVAEKGNAPYLLPSDKIPDFIASDDFYQAQSIYRLLAGSQADQVIAFMDSCFTGTTDGKSVFGGSKAATRLQPKTMQVQKHEPLAIFTAGTDKQFSNALPETGHRLFSYYLMKAMLKGYDSVGDLAMRVRADVNEKSLDLGGLNRQTPVLIGNPGLGF